jgi:hypothetical protein
MTNKSLKPKLLTVALFNVISILSSCEKIDIPIENLHTVQNLSNEQLALVKQSKEWYRDELLKENKSSKTKKTFIGDPDWSNATLLKIENIGSNGFEEFVRVPLINYPINCSYAQNMSPSGFRDLLIRKKTEDYYILNIIELHPDIDYVKRKKNESGNSQKEIRSIIKNEDYTGYFLVYSHYTNELVFGERRENGIPISRLEP